jgi:hypothetical protein
MPYTSLRAGRINIQIYHKAVSSATREFYDIFPVDPESDDIRVSAYRIHGDIKEISILMPGVRALLQCFARLGYSPREALTVLAKIGTEKDVLIGDFSILHSSVRKDGTFVYSNTGYPSPLLYVRSSSKFYSLQGENPAVKESREALEPGDMLIIACKNFFQFITGNIDEYRMILEKNYSLSLDNLKMIFVNKLADERKKIEDSDEEAEDRLLILIRVEEVS